LLFLTAIIPRIKAIMLARNVIGTVMSHQWSSKDRIPNTFTRIIEVIIAIKKNEFNPTDHFPRIVLGAILSFIFFN